MIEAVTAFRQELSVLREKVNGENGGMAEIVENIGQALALHSREYERVLREREQELTVDHELELGDAKKMLLSRDEEIRTLKETMLEKETEFAEQEHLMSTRLLRQKMENHQEEVRNLQARFQSQLDEAFEQARIDKDNAVKQAREAGLVEITTITNTLEQCRQKVCELETSLATTQADQQKIIKEATDKMQLEYKTELETIRSRFKLMAASTVMERSPSDSSLEKIEVR